MFSREHQQLVFDAARRIPPAARCSWFKDVCDYIRPKLQPQTADVLAAIEFADMRHGGEALKAAGA
jgi:hypothetical protein